MQEPVLEHRAPETKPIPDIDDYEVTVDGLVYRTGRYSSPNTVRYNKHLPRLLIQYERDGYATVIVRVNGRQRTRYVHRLVAKAWIGPPPHGKPYCCHDDGDKRTNHAHNLRWDSPKGNSQDMLRHNTAQIGEKSVNAKLTDKQAKEILYRVASGEKINAIAPSYGVSRGAVESMASRKTWKHIILPQTILDQIAKNKSNAGIKNGRSTYKESDILEIRRLNAEGGSFRVIAALYNSSASNISLICRRKRWRHI